MVPFPAHVRPMLATSGPLPADQAAHTFEFKWDGIRAIALWDGDRLRLETRNLRECTIAYPELAGLGPSLGPTPVVLDGEIVSLDERGAPSFQRLQERMHIGDAATAARKAATAPVLYLVFDVVHLGDRSLLDRPWTERRAILDDLGVSGPSWATTPTFPGEGDVTMEAAGQRFLEGVVAKRLDSTYAPGARSRAWVKVKLLRRDEFVIGGWMPGEGRRSGRIGSLLVGLPVGGGLAYVGGVGTGFTERELRRLEERLAPLATDASPFTAGPAPKRGARFVRPEVVVDVEYRERTDEGILRQPSYKGERIDKTPADVNTDTWVGAPDRPPRST